MILVRGRRSGEQGRGTYCSESVLNDGDDRIGGKGEICAVESGHTGLAHDERASVDPEGRRRVCEDQGRKGEVLYHSKTGTSLF